MGYSEKNSLKVFVSPYSTPSTQLTLAELLTGEIGFYDSVGNLALSGLGRFHWKKSDGKVAHTRELTFSGWAAVKSYSAPVMETQTVTIPTATAGAQYQLRIESKIPGMQGEYFKHGNHKAITGDTTTDIATALAASINLSFTREEKAYFTITSSSAIITIVQLAQTYKKAKKPGRPISFKSSLSYPQDDAVLGIVTVSGSDGIGYGPYIAEQEMLAQGHQDHFRFNDWPNSFDFDSLEASTAGAYDVLDLNDKVAIPTIMGTVHAPQDVLLCFDTLLLSVETDFTAFTFPEQGPSPATIDTGAHTIAIDVVNGTTVTALVASFASSPGSIVDVSDTLQVSGTTANNFTAPVVYTVTAEDGVTEQDWTVTVTVL